MNPIFDIEISDYRIHFLFEEVYTLYNIDFRHYNLNHLKRRVLHHIRFRSFSSFDEFYGKIFSNSKEFNLFMKTMSVQVTDMFRDAPFFSFLRNRVIPEFINQADIRIWVAGCSTGEEVYALVILLSQLNIIDKSRIIASDFSNDALELASRGVYSLDKFERFERNYKECGGDSDLKSYFIIKKDHVKINPELSRKIVFAKHNLVTDQYFNNMDMILCRNVLIYFNSELQQNTIDLFYKSLNNKGYLGLGNQESIYMEMYQQKFNLITKDSSIYQKL